MDEEQLQVSEAQQRLDSEAGLDRKMSDRVHVQRWPGPMGPVFGPTVFILDLDDIASKLAISGFMRPWIEERIKEHLVEGGTFTNKGASLLEDEIAMVPGTKVLGMQVRSEYRMATEEEVLNYVDTAEYATITGHKITARSQQKGYVLHYHEGAALIAAYDNLPRQAKVILDVLNDSGRENFTEASIEVVLSNNIEALKTRQDPMKVFGFYRRRLLDDGHLEEVEA